MDNPLGRSHEPFANLVVLLSHHRCLRVVRLFGVGDGTRWHFLSRYLLHVQDSVVRRWPRQSDHRVHVQWDEDIRRECNGGDVSL